jgi:hypothetical protein
MTREELIKIVALKMDEISSSDDVRVPVGTGDNNPLYTQINSLINESINETLMKVPIYRIQNQIGKMIVTSPIAVGGISRKTAVFTVPSDFIRLAQITDPLFKRPIVDLAVEGDDIDKKQHNKFLVAKYSKPVAVLGRGEAGRTITCYSYNESDTPSATMLYVKRYTTSNTIDEDMGLDDYMIDLVSWVCAGKVFAAQGDINKGKICDDNATALMI